MTYTFDDDLFEVFLREYVKLLNDYKQGLQKLKTAPEEGIKVLFRVFHTLKSDSAFFPLKEFSQFTSRSCEILRNRKVEDLTPEVETYLEQIAPYLEQFYEWLVGPKTDQMPVPSKELKDTLTKLEKYYALA